MRSIRFAVLSLSLAAGAAAGAQAPADLYRQSYAAEAKGDHPAALAALEAMQGQSADYVWQLRRGWLLYLSGRHEDAASAYEKAIELEPKAVEARLGAMMPLMALRRWKDAERLGNEVLAVAPNEFTAISRIGYIHYSQSRWDKAEAAYRKALALYPGSVEMRAGLGWSLLKQNKLKDAKAELERVLAVAPDHVSAREGLALLK